MPNSLCHFELAVGDVARAKRFYGAVFDWKFDDTRFPGYTSIDTGRGIPGGMMPKPPMSPAAALESYFRVDDVAKTLEAVAEAGGTIIVPRTEIPGVGWFAMFLDLDRIPIGILESTMADLPGS